MTTINEKPEIKGYRNLTREEILLMNNIKEHAIKIGELADRMKTVPGIDIRWLHIGITDLQKGFMAITRAVAKPETF